MCGPPNFSNRRGESCAHRRCFFFRMRFANMHTRLAMHPPHRQHCVNYRNDASALTLKTAPTVGQELAAVQATGACRLRVLGGYGCIPSDTGR